MTTSDDLHTLRSLGWTWTRIGSYFGVSEREVMRWASDGFPARAVSVPKPIILDYQPVFVVNDTQYPHHDPALWEVTCQVARDAEVEEIVYAGDMLDFEQLSSFKFDPHKTDKAADDVEGFHAELREPLLSGLNKPREHWVDGNHEHRYTRFMEQHAALEDPDPVRFMKLKEMNSFYPYGSRIGHYITPELAVVHGWETGKTTALRNHVKEMGCSVIHGHTHRVGQVRQRIGNRLVAGWEVGHMADYRKVPGHHGKGIPDWQQVAGTLVHKARKGESFHVEVLEVVGEKEDKVFANGRVYKIAR